MRYLRFDDPLKRDKSDKLSPIREVFDLCIAACRRMYIPGATLTVDEALVPFRGRCSFRMYLPSKPKKFGLKIYCTVDPATMYLCNASVFLGKHAQKKENTKEVISRERTSDK